MSMQDRIELLKKAREAKKAKQEERRAEKEANPPPRGRRPKPKPEEKTLDLVDNNQVKDEELDDILKPEHEPEPEPKPKNVKRTSKKTNVVPEQVQEQEPEIIEQVETRRIKKPKKRIIRKIIKEQYDSDSTDVSYEEVVYKAPTYRSKAKPKEVEKPPELPKPREPEVTKESKPSLNIFGY